ncbi:efflux RND transporter periplasmic adaptor subunit [Halomonas sp. MCCC 1A17488]|jgi:RND family efflux transporter MFP subunit|uniref:Efflux RND transporter periplasmic adaptor subunit n=1 Tax=Billgrantia sulfidoxydans TaxID=2733484 RepID=A0ABX7W075_9GAMM|nr:MULTISPECIES: efflux RND transporter periplasmic adaptor subunit [Halomonas]MDX5434280.1 efflux RND transporter periplasmic adaptor subunit [Halomonas sp.]MCE8017048.1 efflux RND transporter periplasmic adaptor subunit [Halomonas sp. MCCC 1A17488]MCE8035023.1 efflux RND transporter periplasmic adaptor subunit [Halomonas sp. MCCC 1A11057]MCG3240381.1 efflux RND transporter periplasmic adaptor subunit [Halomonas sp. MCCC 1A17488]MDX5503785.1 efflux RND transporter periplasmic adaptor subunit 
MTVLAQRLGRVLAVVIGLAVGVVLLVMFVVNRQTPEHSDSPPAPKAVAVIEARPLPFRLEARGHGVARPAETWQAVANVSGRVVERHPALESGTLLRAGTLLLALDPSRYELAIAEAEAELTQLEAEEANTRRLLGLERQALDLAEQELSRIERLASTGSVSTSQRDAQRRSTVAQRQAVATLENALALLPAQRERASVRLAQARRDLADTRFVAPYDLRLGEVEVELHQFVSVGQSLFEADSLAAAEVEARLPFSVVRRLLGSVAPAELEPGSLDLSERIDLDAIDAELELVGASGVGWTGRVVRVASGLDPATRAVRIVVRVDHPWRGARPPDRPPLQRDMYTRVRLTAPGPEASMVVPSSALHQGELYLADEQGRLVRRPVSVAFKQGGLAVIEAGLVPGERVILDDLQPAIDGMALSVRRDDAAEARLAALARGEASSGERP